MRYRHHCIRRRAGFSCFTLDGHIWGFFADGIGHEYWDIRDATGLYFFSEMGMGAHWDSVMLYVRVDGVFDGINRRSMIHMADDVLLVSES